MSIKYLSMVFEDETLKSNGKLLMLAIADNASDQQGEAGTCFPSIKTLMNKCGLSNRAVINNLDKLIEKGYLKKAYRSRKKGGRSSNKYLIYPLKTMNELDDFHKKLFIQSEECSQVKGSQSEECSQPPKVKNVHRGSEECSQGIATQSEECSQESEPSLISSNRQPKVVSVANAPAPSTHIFNAYSEAMRIAYNNPNIEPARSAKTNGLLKTLIERVGFDGAMLVASNYPFHKNQYYVQRTHAVEFMVKDCEQILVQVQANQMITRTQALQADKQGAFDNRVQQMTNDPLGQETF
jgi:hypothetical protein